MFFDHSVALRSSLALLPAFTLHIGGQIAATCPHGRPGSLSTTAATMTLVAVHAVVNIALDALVVAVRLRFRVAICALENRVVVGICMARSAYPIGVAMVDRERGVLSVIERRVQPVRGAVTILASRREKLRLRRMSGIRRAVVICLVTADTRRRQRLVVVVDMAVDAHSWWHRVRSGQRKLGLVVIERRIGPGDRVMAQLASRREARVWHRTHRVLEIGLMARNAKIAVQVVVVVDMALGACSRGHRMRTRQREPGLRVIKLAIGPLNGVMALFAGGRKA